MICSEFNSQAIEVDLNFSSYDREATEKLPLCILHGKLASLRAFQCFDGLENLSRRLTQLVAEGDHCSCSGVINGIIQVVHRLSNRGEPSVDSFSWT